MNLRDVRKLQSDQTNFRWVLSKYCCFFSRIRQSCAVYRKSEKWSIWEFLSDDIKKSKTIFNTPPTIEGAPTAHSIILVTPDAQRTMCTYLGASVEFEPNDIDFTVIKESKYLYLEGYLWDSELAKKAFIKAAQIAKQSNTKIILSLSDSFCVERHRESFLELICEFVDIVFCNESEVLSLFKMIIIKLPRRPILLMWISHSNSWKQWFSNS